ncbi:MAG: sigma-70 family RNA polymerase sigma factor [Proteobacteria bacterium]|nr:sigma-70 family RNA polymerase sigma factor [Pseudomonadota bacterium]
MGASLEEAEDLVADAIVVLRSRPDRYDLSTSPIGLIRTIVRNAYIDRYRVRTNRARLHLRLVEPDSTVFGDRELVRQTAHANRQRLLDALEPAERIVWDAWVRQRERELDGPQAAAVVGVTYGEYENRKRKLRRRVHSVMEMLDLRFDDLLDPPEGSR